MKKRHKRRRMDPHTVLVIRQVLIGVMIVSFIAMLVLSIWYGSRIEALTITEVTSEGGETISHDEVKERVWSKLEGEYLGLVPRVFAWTYPHDEILESVNEVKRIKDVRVHRTDGKTIAVTFDEYIPDSLWCDLREEAYCYFMDDEGYAFTEAPPLLGGAFIRFTRVGDEPKLHEPYTTEENFAAIQKLILLLDDAGWYVSRVDLDSKSDIYLHIVGGGELKATLHQTPTETVNNLVTVLNSDEFSDITPGNFKYIDLRFGNKVFVNEALDTEVEDEMASSTEELETEL